MASLADQAEEIRTKEDFVQFVAALSEVYEKHREEWEWENDTLETYLGALARWTDDMDGYYKNLGEA